GFLRPSSRPGASGKCSGPAPEGPARGGPASARLCAAAERPRFRALAPLNLEDIPMLPDPLHPAIVHFPVVLATLLPLVALLGLPAVGRGTGPRKAWGDVTLVAFLLCASAFTAVKTGENEEDRVEEVVDHDTSHEHEEKGERLQLFAGIGFLVIAAGLS